MLLRRKGGRSERARVPGKLCDHSTSPSISGFVVVSGALAHLQVEPVHFSAGDAVVDGFPEPEDVAFSDPHPEACHYAAQEEGPRSQSDELNRRNADVVQ